MALPIPRDPPVTTAALPVRSITRGPPVGARSGSPGATWSEGDIHGSGAVHQLGEGVGDRVDRVPVHRQPDAHVLRLDRRVAGDPAGRIGRPVDRHRAAREAGPERDDRHVVADLDPALVHRFGERDRHGSGGGVAVLVEVDPCRPNVDAKAPSYNNVFLLAWLAEYTHPHKHQRHM